MPRSAGIGISPGKSCATVVAAVAIDLPMRDLRAAASKRRLPADCPEIGLCYNCLKPSDTLLFGVITDPS